MATSCTYCAVAATLLGLLIGVEGYTVSPKLRVGFSRGIRKMSMTATQPPATTLFTQEMRQRAMDLHTFSQAKEGKVKDQSASTQVEQWQTTKEDFLQFLVDSRVVYESFERAVEKPELQVLRNTGLERVASLKNDIEFIETKFGLRAQPATPAAIQYADYVQKLSPQVFVTHFYNYYFAHTAGGRMIGKTVMDSVFDGHLFEFYQWGKDVKEILADVKGRIDALAAGWSRAEKDAALDATPETFEKSGALLRVLVGKAMSRAARALNKVTKRDGLIVGVGPSPYSLRRSPWDV